MLVSVMTGKAMTTCFRSLCGPRANVPKILWYHNHARLFIRSHASTGWAGLYTHYFLRRSMLAFTVLLQEVFSTLQAGFVQLAACDL